MPPQFSAKDRALAVELMREHAFASPISTDDVGFELRVTALQCKLKLNQHRRESHVAMHAAYAQGTPDEQALAGWMPRPGMRIRDGQDVDHA